MGLEAMQGVRKAGPWGGSIPASLVVSPAGRIRTRFLKGQRLTIFTDRA